MYVLGYIVSLAVLFAFIWLLFPYSLAFILFITLMWDADLIDTAGNIISNRREIKYGSRWKRRDRTLIDKSRGGMRYDNIKGD